MRPCTYKYDHPSYHPPPGNGRSPTTLETPLRTRRLEPSGAGYWRKRSPEASRGSSEVRLSVYVCVSLVSPQVVAISNRSSRTSRPGYVFSAVDRNVSHPFRPILLLILLLLRYIYIYIHIFFLSPPFFFLIFPPLLSIDVRSSSNTRARACSRRRATSRCTPPAPIEPPTIQEPSRFSSPVFVLLIYFLTSALLSPHSTLMS